MDIQKINVAEHRDAIVPSGGTPCVSVSTIVLHFLSVRSFKTLARRTDDRSLLFWESRISLLSPNS